MDLLEHNRRAWNHLVAEGNQWTVPATRAEIDAAVAGGCRTVLTPHKPIPADWLGDVRGKRVLCLASGGGQQGPILAAAGAEVTVFDNSDAQLARDREAADAFGLCIRTVQGNMQDLGCFPDASFDLIVHPVSDCFTDDVLPVWRECYRVLSSKGTLSPGTLLAAFVNPLMYMIDWDVAERTGRCEIRYAIPYSDLRSLPPEALARRVEEMSPLEFGHTLADLIGGQIAAGFVIAGYYEDKGEPLLDAYTDAYIATRAIKPPRGGW